VLPFVSTLAHGLEECLQFLGREGLLLASVFLLLGVLLGLGHGIGLPSLFWRTTIDAGPRGRSARFLVGLAVGTLLGADALILMLVESRERTWTVEAFLFRFEILSLVAFLLVLSIGCLRALFGRDRPESLLLPLGSGASLALFVLLVQTLPSRTPPLVTSFVSRFIPPLESPELLPFHLAAGALLLLGGILYLFLLLTNRALRWHVLPAAAICLLLLVVGAVHGFVAFRWPAAQIPTYLALLGGYALLSAWFQRAGVPDLERLPPGASGPGPLLSDLEVLNTWRLRHDERPVLVVVAADGGGVRSALWTATVLTRIEREVPTFARHVRLITGASGGMLGATLWTSTLVDPPGALAPHHCSGGATLTRDALLDITEKGGLSAVAAGLVFRDVLPPPLRRGPDRGLELELAWEEHCPELRSPVSALAAGEAEGWRPSVVLSPMVVEDGRRLLIANLDLQHLLDNDGPLALGRSRYSLGGVQLFRKLPGARDTLRTSTAIRLQANFPWALPSTEIPPLDPGAPRLRVVDAGYYDEPGVDLACLWLFHHREWLKENTSGVLLVQNRDTSLSIARQHLPSRDRPFWERGVDFLLTPVSAVLRAWGSTSWYRDDAAVAALAQVLDGGTGDRFTTVVFELTQEAALSWSITPDEAREIRGDIDRGANEGALLQLQKWWASRQPGGA
jgi:hypothetical protein